MSQSVILVTGALTGIGRAAAVTFAKLGAQLVVSGRRQAEGDALQTVLRELGADAHFVKADVREDDQVANLLDKTVALFGRIDAAVNNAGTEGAPGPITNQTADSYAATFDTNVLGTILSLKHEFRIMMAQKHGAIVNISSTFGHSGAQGASLYSASKHAVEGLTKSTALEGAAFGIRVNAIAPGATATGMLDRFAGSPETVAKLAAAVPMGRTAKPEEIAAAIAFLASDAAAFVTGQILSVDGGKSAG